MSSDQGVRGINIDYIDPSIKPCDDFYQFANGRWLAGNPIPPDRVSWGVGSELLENKLAVLHQILEEVTADGAEPPDSPQRKVGDFYWSGMDVARIEAEGVRPLAREFSRIADIKDLSGLQVELARLHRHKIFPIFQCGAYQDFNNSARTVMWLYQGRLGLPHCKYYTGDTRWSKEVRKEYGIHVRNIFVLLGDAPVSAELKAETVIEIETRLANASMSLVEQRDPNSIYHLTDIAELDSLPSGFSWRNYFKGIGIREPGQINIGQPAFFEEVGRILSAVPLSDWKIFFRWKLISATADQLSSAFEQEDFRFNGRILHGILEPRPRWKRVLQATERALGEALGHLYAARTFSREAKAKAQELVSNLKAALRERLSEIDWIGEQTRQQALRKLDAMGVKLGHPDKWCDYSGLSIDRGPYVLNALRADAYDFNRTLNRIGMPVDRTTWELAPSAVNAYYNPNFNEIVIPAGVLQPPLFDPEADDASNYGAIGSILGHEILHGFDDQGRKFDAEGNLRNWWSEEDEKNYHARAELLVEQFNQYVVLGDARVDGRLTLGENIADLGGLRIAYRAFQKRLEKYPISAADGGLTPEQRFFVAFAQGWRCKLRPGVLRLMLSADTHSPPSLRVLGTLSNVPEFFQAFGCQAVGTGPRRGDLNIW